VAWGSSTGHLPAPTVNCRLSTVYCLLHESSQLLALTRRQRHEPDADAVSPLVDALSADKEDFRVVGKLELEVNSPTRMVARLEKPANTNPRYTDVISAGKSGDAVLVGVEDEIDRSSAIMSALSHGPLAVPAGGVTRELSLCPSLTQRARRRAAHNNTHHRGGHSATQLVGVSSSHTAPPVGDLM
jgi:hypothetical protein